MGQCCSKQKRKHCKCYAGSSHELSAISRSRNGSTSSISSTASDQLITEKAVEQPGPSNSHIEEDETLALKPQTTPQKKTFQQAEKEQIVANKLNIDLRDASVSGSAVVGVENMHQTNIYYNNVSERQSPTEEDKDAAIKKHQEQHLKSLPESVVLHDPKKKYSQLPDVHPKMHEYEAYGGKGPVRKVNFTPSTQQQKLYSTANPKPVFFTDILNLNLSKRFIAIVGPPGSGKTTLSKQLAKFSQPNQSAKFLIRFMDLNYEQPLTYKQLFVDFLCPRLDKETKENAFQWMVEHQDKCVFVFDGYDQAVWTLENMKPPNVDYDTPLTIQQLVANVCCKKIFVDSLLIFTSRPHSILKIPSELRPAITIYIDDLSTEDMEKLFCALAGEKADELWDLLSTKTPQLFGLCHNPLLLQFIVFAVLHRGVKRVKTVTEVFQTVLEQLRYSEHARQMDIGKLWEPIGKMAYEGMLQKTVVFNRQNLGDLDATVVQDVIIAFSRIIGFPSQRLFDGDQLFYFLHQMLQEMFAAKYISEFMSDEEFHKIVTEVAKGGHWSMVRRFLCGLLLGEGKGMTPQLVGPSTSMYSYNLAEAMQEQRADKVKMFRDKHIEFMKTNLRGYALIDLFTDLQECSDDEKNLLATYLSPMLHLSYTPISSSAAHTLAEILVRLDRDVKWLYLNKCHLNSDTLTLICGGINEMKHEVKILDLCDNKLGVDELKIISGCLNKVRGVVLKDEITAAGLEVLCSEIKHLDIPMEYLDLSRNEFGVEELTIISCFINKVKKLVLKECKLSTDGLAVLCGEIKHLDMPMEFLDLTGNKFEMDEVEIISGCLINVTNLVLAGCGISDDGKQMLYAELERLGLPSWNIYIG